jgi:uncharacterized protein YjiS (DUF1127 family)
LGCIEVCKKREQEARRALRALDRTMKTSIYFPNLANLVGLARHLAPTRNPNGRFADPDMASHLLRDIGLRRGPIGPDGSHLLPF